MVKVFSNEWFSKHQNKLLIALNFPGVSGCLRNILGLEKNKAVAWITPEAIGYKIGKKEIRAIIYSDDHFAQLLYKEFYRVWDIFHRWDESIANVYVPKLNLGFDTLTSYPDAGSGTTDTVDGEIVSSGTTSWASTRAGENLVAYESNNDIYVEASFDGFSTYTISRAYLSFKTGLLGQGSTINSGSLNIYGSSVSADTGYLIHIVSGYTSDYNNVPTGAWGSSGTTSYGSIQISSYSGSANNAITMNSTGLNTISKTGLTAFALRFGIDINDIAPTATNYISFKAADNGTNKPYLSIDYTAATGTQTVAYNSTGIFVVPTGITSITAKCTGGGGRGGTRSTSGSGGGGGGGAYAEGVVSVTAGNVYTCFVGSGSSSGGTAGGDSYFDTAGTVMAKGGSSCADNSDVGVAGGSSGTSVGTIKFAGGTGANGVGGSYGGGGGEAADSAANGNNGSGVAGGSGGAGGDGGTGAAVNNSNGNPGSTPGGGGGGARRTNSVRSGGSGANGRVVVEYTYSSGFGGARLGDFFFGMVY